MWPNTSKNCWFEHFCAVGSQHEKIGWWKVCNPEHGAAELKSTAKRLLCLEMEQKGKKSGWKPSFVRCFSSFMDFNFCILLCVFFYEASWLPPKNWALGHSQTAGATPEAKNQVLFHPVSNHSQMAEKWGFGPSSGRYQTWPCMANAQTACWHLTFSGLTWTAKEAVRKSFQTPGEAPQTGGHLGKKKGQHMASRTRDKEISDKDTSNRGTSSSKPAMECDTKTCTRRNGHVEIKSSGIAGREIGLQLFSCLDNFKLKYLKILNHFHLHGIYPIQTSN